MSKDKDEVLEANKAKGLENAEELPTNKVGYPEMADRDLPDRHALSIVDFGRGAQPAVDTRSEKYVPNLPPANDGGVDVSGVSVPAAEVRVVPTGTVDPDDQPGAEVKPEGGPFVGTVESTAEGPEVTDAHVVSGKDVKAAAAEQGVEPDPDQVADADANAKAAKKTGKKATN